MNNFDDLLNNTTEQSSVPSLSKEEYAAKKKAEREELFALSDQTALEVTADGGKFQTFLDLQARLDRYSAVNALLAFAQNPTASRLGDFDYWKRQNASVRPGQTAIRILEPHEYTKEDGFPATGYNAKKVFDISQVDTRKMRTSPPPRYTERQILGALVSKAPMKITGVDELPNGIYAMTDPKTGEIFIRKGLDFARTFSALAQNMAAAELVGRQGSQLEPGFPDACVSYMLCKKYGIETQLFRFDDAPDVFDGMDAQEIKGELAGIRDAAENISGRMERQLEAQQKAAKSNDAR